MPSQRLRPLKARIAEAQKELDAILTVTPNKQAILDDLLTQIKIAQKTIDDDFAQRKMELERNHLARIEEYETEEQKIASQLENIKIHEKERTEVSQELDIKLSGLKTEVNEERTTLRVITQEADKLKQEVLDCRTDKTTLENDIDALKREKKRLDDEISAQVMQKTTEAYEMRSQLVKERDQLEVKINEAKDELRSIQQALLINQNKQTEIEEEYKRRDNDLIQRENKLIIKTKALAKEKLEFDTEARHWTNHIKSLQM